MVSTWKKEMGWDGRDRIEQIYVTMDNKHPVKYEDVTWLIDELERFGGALEDAEKLIKCTDEQKVKRNKDLVLLRIKKALLPWRLPEEGVT